MFRLLLLLLPTLTFAQGIDFFEGSWQEALDKAEREDKLLFVDAYAEWCGPCKMMSARVFPAEEVGSYFNTHFVSVKYDMEKDASADFRKYHSASAYPTLLFIDAGNELVHRVVGARQATQLLSDAATALSRTDNMEKLREAYEAGEAESALPYVRALVRKGEPHLKVANDYLRAPGVDLTAPASLRLIFLATTEADGRLFDLLLEHRVAIESLEGKEAYLSKREGAVRNSFDKALEYRTPGLLVTTVDRVARYDKDAARRLESEGTLAFALQGSDLKDVEKAAKNYLKKGAAGDENRLRDLFGILEQSTFIGHGAIIDLAAEALTGAAELSSEGWRDYYTLARFLQKRQRYDQGLAAAEQSLKALGADGPANYRRAVEDLVAQLRAVVE